MEDIHVLMNLEVFLDKNINWTGSRESKTSSVKLTKNWPHCTFKAGGTNGFMTVTNDLGGRVLARELGKEPISVQVDLTFIGYDLHNPSADMYDLRLTLSTSAGERNLLEMLRGWFGDNITLSVYLTPILAMAVPADSDCRGVLSAKRMTISPKTYTCRRRFAPDEYVSLMRRDWELTVKIEVHIPDNFIGSRSPDILLEQELESLSDRDRELGSTSLGLVYDMCSLPNGLGYRYLAASLRLLENSIDHGRKFMYIKAISSVLWEVAEKGNGRDLEKILTPQLLQKFYKCSKKLQSEGEGDAMLKLVVDYLICSMCFCRPVLFVHLIYSMNLLQVKQETELNGCNPIEMLEKWHNERSIWTKLMPTDLQDLDLDLSCLETLSRAVQSPTSAKILKESTLLESLHFTVFDFCKGFRGPQVNSKTLTQLVKILQFSKDVSIIKDFRDWFGVTGEDFWLPVLKLFSRPPFNLEWKKVESSMIDLLKILCSAHPENQKRILLPLKKVISKGEKLSAFCQKLLQELLCGDEYTYVRLQSESKLAFKTQTQIQGPMESHPSLDPKGKDCIILVKTTTTAKEILEMFKDSKNLHLGLHSRPDVQIPLFIPMKTLICASMEDQSKSDGHPIPLLDTLQLSLRNQRKQPDQNLSTIAPYPSSLEVISNDGGLLLIFQRVNPKAQNSQVSPHIIRSLRHFLNLPSYPEVLLGDVFRETTDYLIRLVLGLTTDAEGNGIVNSKVSKSMDILPFEALNWVLEETHPSSTEEGQILRREIVQSRSIDFVLEYLQRMQETKQAPSKVRVPEYRLDDSGWDLSEVHEALQRKKFQEETLIRLLSILSNFINTPGVIENNTDLFTPEVIVLLKNSTLISVISSYLRNDSVLDIAGHVPLYRVILQLLRSMVATQQLRSLLVSGSAVGVGDSIISRLLMKMKDTVTTYSQLLEASNEKDFDLDELVKDIQRTAIQVEEAVKEFQAGADVKDEDEEKTGAFIGFPHSVPTKTREERYLEEMKKLQFEFVEMIGDGQEFRFPFHFESEARKNWTETGSKIHLRARRLAKESATLSSSSSLPLSYGSSIFLRCDHDRLDVIKVLITGAVGTPYANGCFQFDVYFPLDYPNSPPKVNLETAKGKGIRFGPHIYTDGQICLTLLNTWSGDPVEKWDPNTSSLLPVLVAIQSVILAEDPEEQRSLEYYANIRHLTVQHAILQQIRNPPECWKEVIQRHFWMKKDEILAQCEEWYELSKEMDRGSRNALKKTVSDLKIAFSQFTPPQGLEDLVKKKDLDFKLKESAKCIGSEDVCPISSKDNSFKPPHELDYVKLDKQKQVVPPQGKKKLWGKGLSMPFVGKKRNKNDQVNCCVQ